MQVHYKEILVKPVEIAIATAFEDQEQVQRNHFTELQVGLRMFEHGLHLIIYPAEQLTDKLLISHAVLRAPHGCDNLRFDEDATLLIEY